MNKIIIDIPRDIVVCKFAGQQQYTTRLSALKRLTVAGLLALYQGRGWRLVSSDQLVYVLKKASILELDAPAPLPRGITHSGGRPKGSTRKTKLTPTLRQYLVWIDWHIRTLTYAPTLEEIAQTFGTKTPNIDRMVRRLCELGYLSRERYKQRSIRVLRLPEAS